MLVDFAIKRHREDAASHKTIKANIFHIRHYLLLRTKKTFSFGDFTYLHDIIIAIKNKNPIPEGCIPFTDIVVVKIIKEFNKLGITKNSWFYYVLRTACVFAWGFMLRCSEYTRTFYWEAPLVSDITFLTGKNNTPVIQYRLERRKTNTHGITEYIAIPCTCDDFKLCCYHTIKKYLKRRKKHGINSQFLFSYIYAQQWKSLSAATFRRELQTVLKIIYQSTYNPKIHRAHSFRYGGITTLGNVGIPQQYIRRISGHSPKSKVLEQYLKMAPKTVASLIKQYYKWKC